MKNENALIINDILEYEIVTNTKEINLEKFFKQKNEHLLNKIISKHFLNKNPNLETNHVYDLIQIGITYGNTTDWLLTENAENIFRENLNKLEKNNAFYKNHEIISTIKVNNEYITLVKK